MKPEALWIIEVLWVHKWDRAWYVDRSSLMDLATRTFPPMPLPIALDIISNRVRPWIYVVSLGSEARWRLRNTTTGEILPGELFA